MCLLLPLLSLMVVCPSLLMLLTSSEFHVSLSACGFLSPGIFFRGFLFYFKKISGHFSLFRVFWEIKFKIWPAWSLCLKKKFLKPKQICILYTEKPQPKKKKVTYTINYKFIWNINYCYLVVSLICLSFINYNLLYYCFVNYKIISCCLA